MATVGQKRSHSDDTEGSDIDEDELLANDDETRDIIDDLQMENLLLSDDEEDDENDDKHETGKPAIERGLNLRAYQEELASVAIQGENTIVYAATGAGKTRVAFYIVKKHLEKNPTGKVAIMADKTFLVNQHYLALQKLLPEYQEKTMCMSDQKERCDALHMLIDEYRVVILTPAIIENTMKQHGDNFMCKFSLLVFDECHHAQKKTTYNRLMTRYHMLKNQGKKPLPQILGLTATLGTNKANSVEKAKEHAFKVMANLDVSKISTVIKNATEYERFRNDIKSERIVLQESGSDDAVHRCIEKYMLQTECLVCTTEDDLGAHDSDEVELASVLKKKESTKRNDPQYITWTGELSNKATALLGKRRSIANKVIVGASYLKIYSEVLDVNDDLTNHFAAKALDKKLNTQHLGRYSQSKDESEVQLSHIAMKLVSELANICNSAQRGTRVNVLLAALKHCSSESKDGARFIVYIKTREQSEMLTELLQAEGYKCAVFTGSSATTDVGGTSRLDQEDVVKQFDEGKIQGLIATTILEEGLDIHDCNFVIKYNHIGNEISTRQTKGRIRRKEGKYTVISDHKGTLRESLNIQRGYLMDKAMEEILGMREDDVRDFIHKEQNTIVQKERNKQGNVANKVPKLDNSKYKMICSKCGKFEINCSALRCINGQHYVIVRPDIWASVSTKPFPKQPPRFDEAITCQARLFGAGGNSCTHELGIVSTYKDVRLPFLSYKFLRVNDTETNRTIILRKWSDAPFHIPDIVDPDDLLAMQK